MEMDVKMSVARAWHSWYMSECHARTPVFSVGVCAGSTTHVGRTPSARVPVFVMVPAAVVVAIETSSANEYTADRAWIVRAGPRAEAQMPEKSPLMKLAKCVAMVSDVSV